MYTSSKFGKGPITTKRVIVKVNLVSIKNFTLYNACSKGCVGLHFRQMVMSWLHLFQTLLYIVQLTLAYWLMLIVMTYNSYLTVAVVLGAGFGHWLFASFQSLQPKVDQFASDACHWSHYHLQIIEPTDSFPLVGAK